MIEEYVQVASPPPPRIPPKPIANLLSLFLACRGLRVIEEESRMDEMGNGKWESSPQGIDR